MNLKHLKYSKDEVWNTLTHGLGFLLAVIGGAYLMYRASVALHMSEIVAVSVYLAGALFVYASSTAYHAAAPGQLKERLQKVDHISIYFMIAGTHTPIILRYFNNLDGYIFLTVMWALVAVGTLFRIIWGDRYETFGLLLYIGMGGMSIFLGPEMLELISSNILYLIITGAVLYFIGVIFYCWETLPYNHPIWHLFVIAGSVMHFFAIYLIVIGQ